MQCGVVTASAADRWAANEIQTKTKQDLQNSRPEVTLGYHCWRGRNRIATMQSWRVNVGWTGSPTCVSCSRDIIEAGLIAGWLINGQEPTSIFYNTKVSG